MHKAMILLLLTFIINQSKAQTITLTPSDNLVTSLNLVQGEQWALDGGVFTRIGEEIYLKKTGNYTLLILDNGNKVTQKRVAITGEQRDNISPTILHIDNKGPDFSLQWKNCIENKDGVIIGKDSYVSWSSPETPVTYTSFINQSTFNTDNQISSFTENNRSLKITAVDRFGNETTQTYHLIPDFSPPQISWELIKPATFKNNQWIAGKLAIAKINATDSSGVKTLSINQRPISVNQVKVKNSDTIHASDILGNTTSTEIYWTVDKLPPNYTINYNEKTHTNKRKLKVQIKKDIIIDVHDEGIGLKYAKFKNKKGLWEDLPKTFQLLSTGNYTIRIIAEDLLGNKLKSKIKFRAKK